jgi:hypothetical protein
MRRLLATRQPLRGAQVGASIHRDFAVAPALHRDPFDAVVAVLALDEEETEFAL